MRGGAHNTKGQPRKRFLIVKGYNYTIAVNGFEPVVATVAEVTEERITITGKNVSLTIERTEPDLVAQLVNQAQNDPAKREQLLRAAREIEKKVGKG